MRHVEPARPSPRARGKGQIREGLRYVKGRPDLVLIMALVFVLGTFGMNFQMTMALMATKVFDKGAGGVRPARLHHGGRLTVRRPCSRRGAPDPGCGCSLVALAGFTVSTSLLATAPTYVLFAVYLVPTGLAALTALTTANAMVQISVDPVMRGRVMALYMAIFMGGTPVGAPVIGWIGDVWGPRWTIAIGTITVGLSLAAVALWFARRHNVAVTFQTRRTPRLRIQFAPQPSWRRLRCRRPEPPPRPCDELQVPAPRDRRRAGAARRHRRRRRPRAPLSRAEVPTRAPRWGRPSTHTPVEPSAEEPWQLRGSSTR